MDGELTEIMNGVSQQLEPLPLWSNVWQERCIDVCTSPLTGDLDLQFTARNVEAGIDDITLSEYFCENGKNAVCFA